MKVFIVARGQHGQAEEVQAAETAAQAVEASGQEPLIAYREITQRGMVAREYMPFVRQEIRQAGLLVVIFNPELRGGLIEVGIAYADGVPVWLLHKPGEQMPNSLQACADKFIVYSNLDELKTKLDGAMINLRVD